MSILEIKKSKKQLVVSEADLSGSKITMAMVNNWELNNVSAKNIKIINADLSDLEIKGAQLGGAYIHNIGMPPEGHPAYDPAAKQRPLKFEDCDLHGSTITNCNLAGVAVSDCNMDGMTIEGVLVSDLLKAYNGSK